MRHILITFVIIPVVIYILPLTGVAQSNVKFNDSHFHLTNYIQEGIGIPDLLELMGDEVGRVALFGIPLQQTWDYNNSGTFAPTYYLQSDAPLYYYSFTDAYIAKIYNDLSEDQKKRFDPMITGFNPADMYAVDHIKRVLSVFPGVFSGIGEFTVHKEFVSSKVAGNKASLTNPALDRILDFCKETGLLVVLHCDIDVPFQSAGGMPVYVKQMKDLVMKHNETPIIWAHTGLGRVVQPSEGGHTGSAVKNPDHLEILETALKDPALNHVYFDISWDEVAKYVIQSEQRINRTAALLNQYPDRFLFGTDVVAPKNKEAYFKVFEMYAPLYSRLNENTRQKVFVQNYNLLFDQAGRKVRDWERKQGYLKNKDY